MTLTRVQFTPTIDTSIYAANDVLFVTTLVKGCFNKVGGKGFLRAVVVGDKDDEGGDIGLIFFNANTSAGTLNNALSISDANVPTILAVVDLGGSYLDIGGAKVLNYAPQDNSVPLVAAEGLQGIYVAGYIVSGTPTYTAATDLVITLFIEEIN